MKEIKEFIESNDFEQSVRYFEKYENNEYEVKLLIDNLIENYGLFIIYILTFISLKKNSPFWFNIAGYTLSFYLSHIEGAERTALAMFKKSFDINPNDNSTLNAILDFRNPPEIILTSKEFVFYSNLLTDR